MPCILIAGGAPAPDAAGYGKFSAAGGKAGGGRLHSIDAYFNEPQEHA